MIVSPLSLNSRQAAAIERMHMLNEILVQVVAISMMFVGFGWARLPWRIVATLPALGFPVMWLVSARADDYDRATQLFMWGLPTITVYCGLLFMGYLLRPTFEMHGLRW